MDILWKTLRNSLNNYWPEILAHEKENTARIQSFSTGSRLQKLQSKEPRVGNTWEES